MSVTKARNVFKSKKQKKVSFKNGLRMYDEETTV